MDECVKTYTTQLHNLHHKYVQVALATFQIKSILIIRGKEFCVENIHTGNNRMSHVHWKKSEHKHFNSKNLMTIRQRNNFYQNLLSYAEMRAVYNSSRPPCYGQLNVPFTVTVATCTIQLSNKREKSPMPNSCDLCPLSGSETNSPVNYIKKRVGTTHINRKEINASNAGIPNKKTVTTQS